VANPLAATAAHFLQLFVGAPVGAQTPPAVIAAWIAGTFAIVAPIITYFVKRAADTYLFQSISKDRRAAIEGHWTGSMGQEFRGHQVAYTGMLQLEVHGRTLRGMLHVTLKFGGQTFEPIFDMSGGFLHDRFARLQYTSKAKGSVHFGAMILELSPAATELKGRFVAFGAFSQEIVSGPIQLVKTQ
jgi:hypothetical protein